MRHPNGGYSYVNDSINLRLLSTYNVSKFVIEYLKMRIAPFFKSPDFSSMKKYGGEMIQSFKPSNLVE